MLSIETKNLTKKFKEKTVVNGIELRINEGELFALLGTNGAGKTTTIKMLSTLILPTDGEIKINEPEKCSELKWCDINDLPKDMVDFEIDAINNWKKNKKFSVIDVDNEKTL